MDVSVCYICACEVAMSDFVSYFRVSTQSQGQSGLGLEAQREAVGRFLSSRQAGSDQPIAEFVEIESGKKSKNRPQLLAAIELCKAKKAVLVIAKLDRLARNVAFIANLMESKVKFLAVDMPEATNLTVHIFSAMAEYEQKAISERTKAALGALKARGEKLGNPRWKESIGRAAKAKSLSAQAPPPAVLKLISKQRGEGVTLNAIAEHLNSLGIKTPQGKPWYPMTVKRALALAA
jgi:DNA invertase Pin-like site-specific DNA recombinase